MYCLSDGRDIKQIFVTISPDHVGGNQVVSQLSQTKNNITVDAREVRLLAGSADYAGLTNGFGLTSKPFFSPEAAGFFSEKIIVKLTGVFSIFVQESSPVRRGPGGAAPECSSPAVQNRYWWSISFN